MRLPQSKEISLAYSISSNNPELDAPITDLVKAIRDLKSSGMTETQIREMTPKMLKKSKHRENGGRSPRDSEILIYDMDDGLIRELIENPQ